ncbi:transcriptional regulator [Streptomyces sp. TUS-ST3]|uniref:AraC family transcriptional regulator n=1 Tax=unclassified Streptomyces TaxID=2593676 RepID=UPI000F4F8538|nr:MULTISPECIES: AraC family transcriptional regulator [unclassified Streptomyces]QUC61741.1 AraC family transcriptional regulator ligand-binding domain-containing protein [Streptomyces sp. A2-16]GLP70304.1 transcriptional regulator [Streptomyces sp. TUS-ST3]
MPPASPASPASRAPDPAKPPGTSRSTSATIQPNILWYLVAVADERGLDLRPQLEQVGLDETVMRSGALRVSYRQGSAVIRRALELTGDEHLGLRVGAAQHLTAWGLLGFALMADDTLRHAIETGVRYQNLSGAMVVWSAGVAEEDGAFVLRADLPDPAMDPAVAVFLSEEAFASVVTLSRLTVGPAFAPRAVEFACPPPRRSEPYGALFGCPVRFGAPANRMVIDPAWARARMPGRDPVTYASTLELLDAQLAARRDQQDLLEVLEISVAQSLPAIPSFAEQARRHATSERTLRRRLADCGTTYEALVEGVRRERVEQLLLRPELTLRDIARRAGFSDERALRRAVRRWHGTSPVQLRERMRTERR